MIETETRGDVLHLRLDAPDRRNALTPDGLTQLEATVSNATAPVVYLHGAGEAFCAGADLGTVRTLDREEAIAFARLGQSVARTIESAPNVVVAGIDGPARGGGVELALACDLRVATPGATLAESGVSLGLFGAWGGTSRLPRLVGEGVALDIALSGRVLDAQTALEYGLVSRVTDTPEEVATTLGGHDPQALAVIKRRMRDTASQRRQDEREAVAFGDLVEAATFESSDQS